VTGIEFIRLPVALDDIIVGDGRRLPESGKLSEITDSIKRVGLLNPISVQMVHDKPILLAGLHRLLALKALGETETVAHVFSDLSETDAELIEIDENLARAELTELERSEQVARRIKLTMQRQSDEPVEHPAEQQEEVLRQLDAKPLGGRPEGGVRAAAREAGVSEADARRAIKISALSSEAKVAAGAYGFNKNQSALLKAAKEIEPEKQVAVLRELHEAKQHKVERKRSDAITLSALEEARQRGNEVVLPAIAAAKAGDEGLKKKLAEAQAKIDVLGEENANLSFLLGELMEEIETIYQDTIDWRVHARSLEKSFPIFARIGADAERRQDAAYPTDDDGNDLETDYVEPGRDELIDTLLDAYNTGQLSAQNQNTEAAA
jgi:hypothetical protein